MKLRVIGWTYYEDDEYQEGDYAWAARNAIIDDIVAHGYEFCGWSHQESMYTVPVLNDGKIYRYSQEAWGGLMAEAHGDLSPMGYTAYDFIVDVEGLRRETRPTSKCRTPLFFEPETDLNERFEAETTKEQLKRAKEHKHVTLPCLDALRYLGENDTLVLKSGEERGEFLVKEAVRQWDMEEKELIDSRRNLMHPDPELRKKAKDAFKNAKFKLEVDLK